MTTKGESTKTEIKKKNLTPEQFKGLYELPHTPTTTIRKEILRYYEPDLKTLLEQCYSGIFEEIRLEDPEVFDEEVKKHISHNISTMMIPKIPSILQFSWLMGQCESYGIDLSPDILNLAKQLVIEANKAFDTYTVELAAQKMAIMHPLFQEADSLAAQDEEDYYASL